MDSSGSSDLSDGSLSSDSSEQSKDVSSRPTSQKGAFPYHSASSPLAPHLSSPRPAPGGTRPQRSPSYSESSSSLDSDGSDSEKDGPHHQVHRLALGEREGKDRKHETATQEFSAPISLSASAPVYSQDVLDRSMMLSPAVQYKTSQLSGSTAAATRGYPSPAGRGRGRGRGRAPLAGHGACKYDAAGATVIDFESFSPPPEDYRQPESAVISTTSRSPSVALAIKAEPSPSISTSNPGRAKKETGKHPKSSKGTGSSKKSGVKKSGRPKSVSQDVYCICRGPYDGVEFMIACDRCEEWFHGRCIGMRPQDAKKSTHYYCDKCRKIRMMFGVGTPEPETSKPTKSKSHASKSSSDKRTGKSGTKQTSQEAQYHVTASQGKLKFTSRIPSDESVARSTDTIHKPKEHTSGQQKHQPLPNVPETPSAPVYGTVQVEKISKSASPEVPAHTQVHTAVPSAVYPDPATLPVSRASAIIDDDEDEDVCPVCDFECTCNIDQTKAPNPSSGFAPPSTPDDPHNFHAIKVPFRPSIAAQQQPPLQPEDSKTLLGIPTISAVSTNNMDSGNNFQTSQKNPMSAPIRERRPSVIRRGGKGIGKAPYLMQSVKSKVPARFQGKGKGYKGGKANIHLFRPSFSDDSSSEMSDDTIPDENALDISHSYEQAMTDSGDDGEVDASLALDTSSSLSDLDEISARQEYDYEELLDRHSAPEQGLGSAALPQGEDSEDDYGEADDGRRLPIKKNRKASRQKKVKASLVVTRVDEDTFYTPAAASRKASSAPRNTHASTEAPSRSKPHNEFPFLSYDFDVAQDVMSVNATHDDGEESDLEEIPQSPTDDFPELVDSDSKPDEDDIFGGSDLSDELSGDLSDISSEDLEDLSDDGLDFSCIDDDEEDETSSSSSPQEYHYSEMEEQDESLVDSDSSGRSASASALSSSESDMNSDDGEAEGSDTFDIDESLYAIEDQEELIDEEELQRLEEQERMLVARAHILHEYISDEEEPDPSKNPFESSEDEEEEIEEDERVFDGDVEDYPDDFYEDDYYDDEYDDMDEAQILAQLKGSQLEMQALMMIPPEQQEQLLLLQHYAELQEQKQGLEKRMIEHGLPSELALLPTVLQQGDPLQQARQGQNLVLENDAEIQRLAEFLPTGSAELLMPFDIGDTELDAETQELAASLANSLASSMAQSATASLPGSNSGSQDLEGDGEVSVFGLPVSSTGVGIHIPGLGTDIGFTSMAESSGEQGSRSLSMTATSASPTTPNTIWSAPPSSTSGSLSSGAFPTPANTPTPPGIVSSIVSNTITQEGSDALNYSSQTELLPLESQSGNYAIPTSTTEQDLVLKESRQSTPSTKTPSSLPNSPAYKPLSSVMSASLTGGRSIQPILPRLVPGENLLDLANAVAATSGISATLLTPSLTVITQSRLHDLNSGSSFKEAAQRAFNGTGIGAKLSSSLSNGSTLTLSQNGEASSSTMESQNDLESRKRKSDETRQQEAILLMHGGKRRKESIHLGALAHGAEDIMDLAGTGSGNTTDTTQTSQGGDRLGLSEASSSPSVDVDFGDISAMSFVDPSARIISPGSIVDAHKFDESDFSTPRLRTPSLKGKELKPDIGEPAVLPMDDLLDTSALYGRSSRSPSPGRTGDAGSEDDEMSQSMLKDLRRWERIPIGTFRKSRRPSSPYVGSLQSALKAGNVTMPTTMLSDHQLRHPLQQESQRIQRRMMSAARKQRAAQAFVSLPSSTGRLMQLKPPLMASNSFSSTSSLPTPLPFPGRLSRSHSNLGLGHSGREALDPGRRKRRIEGVKGSMGAGRSMSIAEGMRGNEKIGLPHGIVGLGLGIEREGFVHTSDKMAIPVGGSRGGNEVELDGLRSLQDMMTDSSQLPSSACPTPLHSPLFSATAASGRVHHHPSGEVSVVMTKTSLGQSSISREESIVHLELDIGKEMEGFQASLEAEKDAN